MKNLPDTNICNHFLKGKFDLLDKITEIGIENCAISEITLAELIFGAENSACSKKNHDLIEKLTEQVSIIPIFNSIFLDGKEKARLRKQGKMISDFDLLIGCTAIENGLIMVTENLKEFNRIKGIKTENWIHRK